MTRKIHKENYYQANKAIILEKLRMKRCNLSLANSLDLFKKEIAWGSIYPCICCHRTRFRTGMRKAELEKLSMLSNFENAVDKSVMSSSKFYIKSSFWICHTCFSYIKNNRVPKQSSMNSLHVYERPDFLELKEVENVLIAPRINFIKLIILPVHHSI